VSTLAKQFGVRLPTAIGILDRLEEKGFVMRKPWKVPKLSRRGVVLAESIMHRHRIVELYFSRILALSFEKSCKEASKVDYLLDKTVIQKMCKALNRPSHCNHGNPIQHPDH
jgi:DtxR family Mn-dependent transcriptional regulator